MAKLTRVLQKVFARTSSAGEIGKFGSLAAGNPETTTDPLLVQSLGNWDAGWFSAILGNNSPAIQDMNGLFYVAFRQLAYLFQQGVAEYDATTEYHIGSAVKDANGVTYQSLVNDNIGEDLTDGTKWIMSSQRNTVSTKTTSSALTLVDEIIFVDATIGNVTLSLPVAATSKGKVYKVKKIDKTINKAIFDPDGAELIEGLATRSAGTYLESYTIVCDGTGWYFI